jgi:two-component system chemotaxis response regulator CheB
VARVKVVSHIRVITHLRGKLGPLGNASPPAALPSPPAPAPSPALGCQVVGIGASTGGPAAILQILRDLPSAFSLPVLFVLHIGEPFGKAFAEWLDGQTSHRVGYARDGETLEAVAGRVVMAPPDRHLLVSEGRLRLSSSPERYSCRPSVDVLFESLAQGYGSAAAGCLLTGMGRDGAAGLLAMRRAGGQTFAQDEESCVVYGMPREAANLDAAGRVLPLGEIGAALASLPGLPAKRGVLR